MKSLFLSCVVSFALSVAPSLASAATPEVKPSADFLGLEVTIQPSGKIVAYVGKREIEGKVAVCGIVFVTGNSSTARVIEPKITEKIRFEIAGQLLRVNTRAFKRYKSEADAMAGNAGCSVTTTPWSAAIGKAKLSVKLARGKVSD